MRKRLLILLSTIILSSSLFAQHKGDFFICYGFEFPSGGYLSLRYYPVDNIGAEIYTSAFWYIFNYGARVNIHQEKSLPHTFFSIGFSHMTAYNPSTVHDTTTGQVLYLSRFMRGIDLGIGRDVEFDFKHLSFQAGPTYVLKIEDSFYNEQHEIETIETDPLFSYFFTGTFLAHLPEKNPKPIRLKSE